MDFLNRNPQPNNSRVSTPAGTPSGESRPKRVPLQPGWIRGLFMALLVSGTTLAVAVVCLLAFTGPREGRYVNDKLYQAVFLTNGQVYFGKIKGISARYVDLQDIYYLNSTQTTGSTKDANAQDSMSLVKLGCELHGPADQMLVNRDQVTFWENLVTDGKVTKAISQWKQKNPQGQNCSTTTNSTNQSQSTTQTTTDKKQ
jgi:hypothetical protein